jgi:hypothetical protein
VARKPLSSMMAMRNRNSAKQARGYAALAKARQ